MPHETPRRLPVPLAIGGAVCIGALTAIQARINGQLGLRLDDGIVAALVSFSSGLIVLLVLTAVLPVGRTGLRRLVSGVGRREIPAWMLLGGVAGAITVATQGLAVGIIGVSLFTVGIVAGQSVNGLILDRIGFGPAGVVAVTVPRLLGGALALAAVAVSLTGDTIAHVAWWMLLLPFGAGVGVAWQQATNGRLRAKVGTPLTATLVNFVGGTAVLAVAALISTAASGAPAPLPGEWWLYLGGPLGVTYIFLAATLVASTGVLLLGLGSVVGQLLGSIVIDALWPTTASPDLLHAGLMVVFALASVAVVAVRPRS